MGSSGRQGRKTRGSHKFFLALSALTQDRSAKQHVRTPVRKQGSQGAEMGTGPLGGRLSQLLKHGGPFGPELSQVLPESQ